MLLPEQCKSNAGWYVIQQNDNSFKVYFSSDAKSVSATLVTVTRLAEIDSTGNKFDVYSSSIDLSTNEKLENRSIRESDGVSDNVIDSWRGSTQIVANSVNIKTGNKFKPFIRCALSNSRLYIDQLNSISNEKLNVTSIVPISFTPKYSWGQDVLPAVQGRKTEELTSEYASVFFRENCGTRLSQDFEVYKLQDDPDYLYGVERDSRNRVTGNFEKQILCIAKRSYADAEIKKYETAAQGDHDEYIKKLEANRSKYSIDTVAKVLNYSSGCSDDGCGDPITSSWVARDAKQCIYERISFEDANSNNSTQAFSNLLKLATLSDSPALGVVTSPSALRLNDLDPRSIKIAVINHTTTERKNINDPNNALRVIGERNIQHEFQTQDVQYMGKTLFSQTNLDEARLERGWKLIYSKFCKGVQKEF